jgi:hypothetical protein
VAEFLHRAADSFLERFFFGVSVEERLEESGIHGTVVVTDEGMGGKKNSVTSS